MIDVQWSRPRREEIVTSFLRVWTLTGTDFRVVESVSRFGLPTRFVAMRGRLAILSEHRAAAPARRSCERAYREQLRAERQAAKEAAAASRRGRKKRKPV